MPASNVTSRFSDRVENDVWYRPGYSLQVLETLKFECGLTPARMVADIASGTGIWDGDLFQRTRQEMRDANLLLIG
jgi:hypothetical protein